MIKSAIYCGRTRIVEDAVDAWKKDYEEAEKVKDIEVIVREWLWAESILSEWQDECWNKLRAGDLVNVLEIGEQLARAYSLRTAALATLTNGIAWAERQGHVVDNLEDFRKTATRMKRLKEEYEKNWPRIGKDEIDDATRSLDQDEGIDTGEWLQQLQGEACQEG